MAMELVLKSFNHWYRVFVTGLSFVIFAVGGIIIGLAVYPILIVFVDKEKQKDKGQRVIHLAFAFFSWFMKFVGIYTLDVINRDQLHIPNQFFIANHPTLIDVVILLSLIKSSDCVVKAALAKNPITKGPLLTAGYIINNSPEDLIEGCVNSLRNGRNLLIFPEGTRTKNLTQLKFKRGAANISIASGYPMTPIIIECKPRILAKGQKWYKIPPLKPHYVIKVGKPISVESLGKSNEHLSTITRKVNSVLLDYYNKELSIGKNDK